MKSRFLFSRRFFLKVFVLQAPILYLKAKGIPRLPITNSAPQRNNEASYGHGAYGTGPYSGQIPYRTYIPTIQKSEVDNG